MIDIKVHTAEERRIKAYYGDALTAVKRARHFVLGIPDATAESFWSSLESQIEGEFREHLGRHRALRDAQKKKRLEPLAEDLAKGENGLGQDLVEGRCEIRGSQ